MDDAEPIKNEIARRFYFSYFSGEKTKGFAIDIVF
jgi:hypothetical protein